jgi:hypothetical protein
MKLGCSARVDDWNKMNECGTRGMDTTINIEYPLFFKGQSHESQHEEEFHQLTSERLVPKHQMACVLLSVV